MNAQHPTDAPSPQGDFIGIAPAVAERLLGEPSSRSARELRWRSKGSFRLKIETGSWQDFEAGESGEVLDLVQREMSVDKDGAVEWLRNQGFLQDRANSGAYGTVSRKTVAAQSP